MSSAGTDSAGEWDYSYEPRWIKRVALVVIVIVLAIHLTFGLLLDVSYTGVSVNWWDKGGLIAMGLVISAAVLYLTRYRLRVGPRGVGVRNLVGERVFGWEQVRGLEYPEKGSYARLLFPHDEHVPVLAVQARDGEAAVEAMQRFRELYAQYGRTRDTSAEVEAKDA